MIADQDQQKLKDIFSQMTVHQIMTYLEYFAPLPIGKIEHMKIKSSEGRRMEIWGKSTPDIYKSIERYRKIDAILG